MTELAVILAGGSGKRLWPLSRQSKPKQFISIASGVSLVRESFLQVQNLFSIEHIFIVALEEQVPQILKDIPELSEEQIIVEPEGRDSGMALALASIYLDIIYPGSTLLIYPVGIFIEYWEELEKALVHGFQFARELSCSILIGVEDENPSVYDCYLEIGDVISRDDEIAVFDIKKISNHYPPDAIMNEEVEVLRHAGIVIVECQSYLEELSEHIPEIYSSLLEIQEQIGKGKEEVIKQKLYQQMMPYQLELDILSKSKRLLALKLSKTLNNIQGWSSLSQLLEKDENDNTFTGLVEAVESHNCLVLGNDHELISLVGIKNIVVVRSQESLLILDKSEDQKVKELVKMIKNKDSYEKFL